MPDTAMTLMSAEMMMKHAPAGMSLHVHATKGGFEANLITGDDLRYIGRGKTIANAINAACNEVRRLQRLELAAAAD